MRKPLDQKHIEALAEQEQAGGKAGLKKASVWYSSLRHHFSVLGLDVGHSVQNPQTQRHRGPYRLYAPTVFVTTATPAINKTADMSGYLNFWKPEWRLPRQEETA